MKKILYILLSFFIVLCLSAEDEPSIVLPEVEIDIQDQKKIEIELRLDDLELPEIEIESQLELELTEKIKVDLEETLPASIDTPEQTKAVDAIIQFGYGLNNSLLADFSIFVKEFNPKIRVHYLRQAQQTYWIDQLDFKTPYSLDHLDSQILFNYKNFSLNSDLGYFGKSYSLQNQSVYPDFTKRTINLDLNPNLKFKFQNDLGLHVKNSFLFTDLSNSDNTAKRFDFDYLLDTDITYNQVFLKNLYFDAHLGYEFKYFQSELELTDHITNQFFYNNIKAGVGISAILKEAFYLKLATDFEGLFKGTEFHWYILPFGKFAYNYLEYFHCYLEGGGSLIEKPEQEWFENNDYVIVPAELLPGYHWYAKTGIKGVVPGWFTAFTDLEFAYNYQGHEWDLVSDQENLYTLKQDNSMELNLTMGAEFSFKEYIKLTASWMHCFLDYSYFDPRETITTSIIFGVPKIGLFFNVDFLAKLVRSQLDGDDAGNIYLMNAGIDWNYQERFGLGIEFTNILYFQRHQSMPGYDDPGFSFLAYIKIGF
ncbi:MAG: hypothetical protein MJB14_19860 [Spirochaetes bacterium]|nr:hypothetical protein [Spirochaetota bacterium]